MCNALGIITYNDSSVYVEGMQKYRPIAAFSFLGRYRLVDFAISNMSNSGIDDIQIYVNGNPRSLIDHVGTGRHYNINSKHGHLSLVPVYSEGGTSRFTTDISCYAENIHAVLENHNDYVVIAPVNMLYKGNYEELENKLHTRKTEISEEVNKAVSEIINNVRENGDDALKEYCAKFDGFHVSRKDDFIVSKQEIMDAITKVGPEFMKILERTKDQITEYHKNQIEKSWTMYKDNGVIMGQLVRPIATVALYVPGGTATYPSTVMMNAVPAKLAGVEDLYIITPVKKDGKVSDVILAAAYVAGITKIYKCGGAQGVAAAAYGTDTITKADKIVGPGNIFVATAKKLCYGVVDIDMIAGPSEILIVADENANPKYIAADLMSQAEHDKLASAILITTSKELVKNVDEELVRQVEDLPRKDIIKSSLDNYGGAVIVDSIKEGINLSNKIAPEHLEVLVDNPLEQLPNIKNAGSIFLGEYTPEPLGDYMSGTNHVLPTGGTAKFYSALGVYDFIKHSAFSYYPQAVLGTFKDDIMKFAHLEGLDAHANSIKVRFED